MIFKNYNKKVIMQNKLLMILKMILKIKIKKLLI